MNDKSTILQLRIELQDVQPLVWRRIQLPGDCTFWDLHVAIQSAFGWNDSHLHEFRLPGDRARDRRFGIRARGCQWCFEHGHPLSIS